MQYYTRDNSIARTYYYLTKQSNKSSDRVL